MQEPKPIYIIGSTPLTYYLAAKITDAQKEVIIIADKQTNLDLNANGFTLKEDYCLRKNKYKIKTSFWIKQTPELVIFTASNAEINSLTTTISPEKIIDVPVVCFTNIKDKDFIETYLRQPLIPAYFDGFLQKSDQTTTLYGRAPQIIFDATTSKNKQEKLQNITKEIGLNCTFSNDSAFCFWNHIIPHAIGSLITATHNQTLNQILKNKKHREELNSYVKEALVIANVTNLSAENVIKKLHTYPTNYIFPLQKEIKTGSSHELEYLSFIFGQQTNSATPLIKNMLKKIYNIILA